jgi:type VI protein secretion system component VasA
MSTDGWTVATLCSGPTPSLRPPLNLLEGCGGVSLVWSHGSAAGLDHLREVLRLYSAADWAPYNPAALGVREACRARAEKVSAEIRGIREITARPCIERVLIEPEGQLLDVPGLEVRLVLDPDQYVAVGRSPLLFASVLERVLRASAPINSFTKTVVECGGEVLKRWPATPGELIPL